MELESLLALDVGGGTQDLLLWRDGQEIENAVKMVLPSPTQVAARRIRAARGQGRDVFLEGWLMGGGAMHRAVGEHLDEGLKVFATPAAAASLADDLDKVRAQGVVICDKPPAGAVTVPTSDLDLKAIRQACALFEVDPPQRLAVALCDHGHSPGFSNRKFRFMMWERFLQKGGRLGDLIFPQAPPDMTRMAALKQQAPGALLMDTAAAAAWGALQDPAVAALAQGGVCIVNLGNMHTVGFLVQGQRVLGVYEHHTGCLDAFSLADQVGRFIQGTLSDSEVFAGQGHGCARLDSAPQGQDWPVVFTGPRRRLASGLGWTLAVPHGDVMLSGCFGLLAASLALVRG
ncbi:MAG: DUF1786 domain-containing protein [Desulfarculus sp.]|nr:DUF1786 domain-containing protein [Desulfarculus sp.]